MLAWWLQISDSDSGAVARDKLTAGVAPLFDQDGESHAHLMGHLIGLDFSASVHVRGILQDAGQIRARGFHAAAQFMRRMAERTALPVVLMLDDLHWADDGSLDFIDHLLHANRDMPLLLLGLTRPSLFERRPDWALASPIHHRIDLGPLNESDSRALAGALLQRIDGAPALLYELITGGAEGNPFYMEELLKMLVDEGAILTDRQPWQVVPDKLVATQVPSTLIGVLQARLDMLPERDKRALQQASVVGVVFWDQALNALCIDTPTPENLVAAAAATSGALESLARRELIHPRRPSAFAGTREFAFKHQILQQVTYHGLLKRQRRQYHARAATWLAGLTGDRATEHLGAAAEHYARSGDHVNACRLFARAAQWAVSRGANTAMLAYVQQALALAPADDHAMRWQLLATRERFLLTSDDRAAHVAELDAMQALAEALDDDARRADVLWRRAFALDDGGDFAAAAMMAQRSLDLARAAGATTEATKAYAGLGYDMMRLGRFQQAQQAVDAGLALARASGNRSLEPHFLTDAGGIARAQGDLGTAMAHFEEALAVTPTARQPRQ
jgi:predicted ATPase